MFIIAGLGNPGDTQDQHNIGFYVVDLLAQAHNIPLNRIRHKAIMGKAASGSEGSAGQAQTYMDLSGRVAFA